MPSFTYDLSLLRLVAFVRAPEPIREGLTGLALLQALRQQIIADANPFPLPGFPEAAVGQTREDYFRPVRPGDVLRDEFQLVSVSPLKRTRVGEGHVTSRRVTHNQRDEVVKAWTITLYMYRTAQS